MAKRKTHEEFIKELYLINADIEIIGKYKNDGTKISCKCKTSKLTNGSRNDSSKRVNRERTR